ncbi:hypothetical protein MYOV003v1_p0025 [Vibrio phage 207E48.1]|nr:hypothetical protein MYOV003v1_p0025 [Vibrio phage 207E48.1]
MFTLIDVSLIVLGVVSYILMGFGFRTTLEGCNHEMNNDGSFLYVLVWPLFLCIIAMIPKIIKDKK